MLKTFTQAFRDPETNTIKAVVEYFLNYEIVDNRVTGRASFYVYGPGEFNWDDWRCGWNVSTANKRPVSKPSEAARLVNRYTGLSINYEPIRQRVLNAILDIQHKHDYQMFLQVRENITTAIKNRMVDVIRDIMQTYDIDLHQEKDEVHCYEEVFNTTTYRFSGESYENNFSIYLDDIMEEVYNTLKDKQQK